MTHKEMNALATISGVIVLNSWELPNGYDKARSDPWWLIRTRIGMLIIGWRKRVIQIDWKDCDVKLDVTADDVTKDDFNVHAWSTEKAVEYLKALAPYLNGDKLDRSACAGRCLRKPLEEGIAFLKSDLREALRVTGQLNRSLTLAVENANV